MQTLKRMLAILLVLAMTLSNLPVAVLAEELSELTAEQTIETIAEETTVETTEAPTETPTEAPTEAATEASTEAATEATEVTEATEETVETVISKDSALVGQGLPSFGFYTGSSPSAANQITEFYADPDQENVFYFGYNRYYMQDRNCYFEPQVGTFTTNYQDYVEVEYVSNVVYKLTLKDEIFEHEGDIELTVWYTATCYWHNDDNTETTEEDSTGYGKIWLRLPEEEETDRTVITITYPENKPYLTFAWLDMNEKGKLVENQFRGTNVMRVVPGQHVYQIYYLNTWDAEQQTYVQTPWKWFRTDGGLSINQVDSSMVADGQENGEYFMDITATEWDKETSIYVMGDDGSRLSGVNVWTDRHQVGFYTAPEMTNANYIWEFEAQWGQTNEFYVGLDCDWFTPSHSVPNFEYTDFFTLTHVSGYVYKITLTDAAMEELRYHGDIWESFSWDGTHNEKGTAQTLDGGIKVTLNRENLPAEGRIVHDYVRNYGEGYFAEGSTVTGLRVCPGDLYEVIFYYATWDETADKWIKQYPVHVKSDLFDIVPMDLEDDEIKAGEENAEYFCRVVSNEWDEEGTFWAKLEDDSTITDHCYSFESEFSFHTEPNRNHDSYIPQWPIYTVDANAEENAFYLTFKSDYWNIEHIYVKEGPAADLKDMGDGIYKITLTEEGVEKALDQYGLSIFHKLVAKDGSGQTGEWSEYIQIYPKQFLSFGWLEERGQGWYEDAVNSGWDKQYGIRPGNEFFHIYYLNTWNPETREYDREPVQVRSASDNLYLKSVADHAREDQENADCFYRVTTDKWNMDTSVYVEVENGEIHLPVYTGLGDRSFHTGATRSISNYISEFHVDPFKRDNSFYFHFVSDWQIDEIRPAPGNEDLFTISHVKEQIFKITLTEKGVGRAVSTGWYMELEFDVSNPWGRETWRDGIYSCVSEEFADSQIAVFGVDYEDYAIFEDGILHLHGDEEGNLTAETVSSLPKGITYNAKSNKVTLNNANYQSLIFVHHWNGAEEGDNNFPSENLTIELKGTSSLRSDVDVAFVARDMNITFTGSGTLNVKGINSLDNTYYNEGLDQEIPYAFPAFQALNSTITFKDSVKVNVEIAGEAQEEVWNENGFAGTRPARLMAINAEGSEIIVTGKATLTTKIPYGARGNGETLDADHEYVFWGYTNPGGYEGMSNFASLTVSGGTMNTQSLYLGSNEELGLDGADFTLTSGTVNIDAQGFHQLRDLYEWDEEQQTDILVDTVNSFYYTGLESELGSVITISGGVLNIDTTPNNNGEYDESVGLFTWGGELNVHGGEIAISAGAEGYAFCLRTAYEENNTPSVFNQTGGEIILAGPEGSYLRAIDLQPGSVANLNGGIIKPLESDLYFGGEVNLNGTEIYGSGCEYHFDGELTMDSGYVCADNECVVYIGMATINGGTFDVMDGYVVVNGGLHFNGGEMLISNDRQGRSWASLIVNTYMEMNGEAFLYIQHNMWPEAMVVAGTFQQQGGTAVIEHYSELGSSAVILPNHWNGEEETHGTFNMFDGDFIVNAEIPLGAREARREIEEFDENEEVWLFAFDSHENSIVDIYGGNIAVNAHNYDDAFHVNGDFWLKDGSLNVSATTDDRYQMYDVGAFAANGNVYIWGGDMNLNGKLTGLSYDALRGGSMEITDGSIYINADAIGMWINGKTKISGGYIGIDINGDELEEDGSKYMLARAMIVNGYDDGPGALTVTGGYFEINTPTEIPDGYDPVYPRFLTANLAPVELLGGTYDLNTNIPLFFLNIDSAPDYKISEDLVIYSRTTGNRLVLLENEFTEGDVNYCCVMLEEDNVPGDLNTDEGVDYLTSTVITTNKAGANVTWKVEDGVLKFDGNGGMYDFSEENAAPWVKLSDVITTVEIDNNLTSIGAYAFNGLEKLGTINFLGNAPKFDENAFAGVKADAFVLIENMGGWSADAMQDYGGDIDWINKYPDESIGKVTVDTTELLAGQKATLTATLFPGNDPDAKVEWALADGDKNYVTLKVLSDGSATVTAKKNKEFRQITVIASVNGIANSAVETYINVLPVVTKVNILDADGNAFEEMPVLAMGTDTESIQLTAVNDPDGSLQEVTWKSSNEKFVSVDEDGVITAVMPGKSATITATAADGSGKKATLKVKTVQPVTGINLDGEAVLAAGKSISLKAEVVPADATNKKVTWEIVEDVDYVSISNGKLKASKTIPEEGATVTVLVTSVENPDIYAECEVTLYPAVTAVSIFADEYEGSVNGETIELDVSEGGLQLYAENTPSGAAQAWTWTSSKDSFIEVDEEGYVTANMVGKTVTITATAADGSGKKATVKVKSVLPVEEITLSGSTVAAAGKTVTLTAAVEPAEATNKKLVWTIESGEEAATISNGKVKINKAAEDGTVITVRAAVADDPDTWAEWDIEVYAAAVNKVYIQNAEGTDITGRTFEEPMSVDGPNTVDLYAVTSGKSLNDEVAQEVTWKSSNETYATVNEYGEVTLRVPGKTVTITATAMDGSNKKATVKIKGIQPVEALTMVEDILVDAYGEIFVAGGKSLKLANYVDIYPATSTNKKLTWTVEDNDYGVKINKSTGVLSTKKVSEMVSVYVSVVTTDGTDLYINDIKVNIYPATTKVTLWLEDGTEVTGKTRTAVIGEEGNLIVKCLPENAAGVYTFKSSNEEYFSIDENGYVQVLDGVGKTVTITVTAADGSGKKATAKWKIAEPTEKDFSNLTEEERAMATAEIRRALSLLIDRSEVSMGQLPASSFVSYGFTDADGSQFYVNAGGNSYNGYWNTDAYEANCKEAMEILTKYFDVDASGKLINFPTISYLYNEGSGHEEIAEKLQSQLLSYGIRLNLKSQEWNTFLNTRQNGNYELARHGWIADYNDPITMLDMWTSHSGNNDAQLGRGNHAEAAIYDLDLTPWGFDIEIENGTWAETYDVLIEEIKNCNSSSVRYELLHLAEDMVMETGCVVPLYYYSDFYTIRESVSGFGTNPSGMKFFQNTTVGGSGDSISVCLGSEPETMDPALVTTVDTSAIIQHLFAGLARWAPDDSGSYTRIEADCAEKLVAPVVNADGTVTYTYTLKDDLVWSDGVDVTAHDFAFAWKRAASSELGAGYGYMFEQIKGYPDNLAVTAEDDKTLTVTLKSNIAHWNEMLAFSAFMPVREDVVANSDWAASAETYVCNGAYTMSSWDHETMIVAQKNENYWDADNISMEEIRFHLGADIETAWKTGTVDFVDDYVSGYSGQYASSLGTYFLVINADLELLP